MEKMIVDETSMTKFDSRRLVEPMLIITTPNCLQRVTLNEYRVPPRCNTRVMINPVIQDLVKKLQDTEPYTAFPDLNALEIY